MIKIISLLLLTVPAFAKDTFKNFADLKAHEQEGVAYHVDVLDRHSPVTVLAIHGGKIEPGSDALAREVAGADLNLYAFVATLPGDNWDLHVTSTHFDDPRALDLVKEATMTLSIHGFKETEKDRACVGGANDQRRAHLAEAIKNSDLHFEVESPCEEYGGSNAHNIVNRGANPGVQIELSTHLRERLLKEPLLLKNFGALIRAEALIK